MKNETLAQKAKKQIMKGFLYWLYRYVSIFVSNAFVIVLICITIGTPLYMIFGTPDNWLSVLLGAACGCIVVITIRNIPRYKYCWLSIRYNLCRYRIIKIIERMPINNSKEILIKGYINSELKDFMEDYTL